MHSPSAKDSGARSSADASPSIQVIAEATPWRAASARFGDERGVDIHAESDRTMASGEIDQQSPLAAAHVDHAIPGSCLRAAGWPMIRWFRHATWREMNRPRRSPATNSRAILVVWSSLLVVALARGVATFLPTMWAWGVNVQRFVGPLSAWLPWGACVMSLHPSVGRRLSQLHSDVGDWLLAGNAGAVVAGLAGAALVWSLPDRTWVTGDFMLRQSLSGSGAYAGTFAQSLPFEVLLDRVVPREVAPFSTADTHLALRAIGACAAAGLAIGALRLVRQWGFTGVAAATSAAIIFFGGYLATFTGLGKPAAVMCLLVTLVILGSLRLAQRGAGGLLGLSLALALFTHRGALLLLPVWMVAVFYALPASGPATRPSRRGLALAISLPVLACVIVAPLILRIMREVDLPGHIAPLAVRRTGVLASAFDGLHLIDLANLVMFYTPAPAIALALGLAVGVRAGGRPEPMLLAALAAPFIPLMLFLHPMQGVIRDLDVFATAGMSLAIVAAYGIGLALERRILPAWLAPAIVLAVVAPSLQWLIHFHDGDRGLQRVRALVLEQPARPDDDRARLWDALAYRAFRLQQWKLAVEASAQSARYAPHARPLIMLAIARTYTGAYGEAEAVYVDLAKRFPEDPLVWVGLGGAALRMADTLEFRRSLAKLNSYAPNSLQARIIRRHLAIFPAVWPTSAELGKRAEP